MRSARANILREARLVPEMIRFSSDAAIDNVTSHINRRQAAVLLIPGFMAGDVTLLPLANRLRAIGHRPFFAGIWCNADCPARTMTRLGDALRRANQRTGSKVVVIGHSLGGIYARQLARRYPELVERVILLGAPLKHPLRNSTPFLKPLARLMLLTHRGCMREMGVACPQCGIDPSPIPPPVPETIIYSRSDAIVDWRSCLEEGPKVETIEVESSHCGLPLSPVTWKLIAARLGDPPRAPFTPHTPLNDGRGRPTRRGIPYLRLATSNVHAA